MKPLPKLQILTTLATLLAISASNVRNAEAVGSTSATDVTEPAATVNTPSARAPQPKQEIPRQIHLFWAGKLEADSTEFKNLMAWGQAARTQIPPDGKAYTVTLWTTGETVFDADTKAQLKAAGVNINENTAKEFSKLEFSADVLPEGVDQQQFNTKSEAYFDKLLKMDGYAGASDIARYAIMQNHGGIYVDADMGPGGMDLSKPPPKMSTDDVPYFAPAFRNKKDWDKGKSAGSKLGVKSRTWTMEQLYTKGINNNLMVAPPNSSFMEQLNVKVQAELDKLDNNARRFNPDGRFTPDQRFGTEVAARVTGPKPVMDLIKERIGDSATDASIGREGSLVKNLFDARAKNISKIQWVTDASDHDASKASSSAHDDPTHQPSSSAHDDSTHQTTSGAHGDSTRQTPPSVHDDATHQTHSGAHDDSTHQPSTVEERCQ